MRNNELTVIFRSVLVRFGLVTLLYPAGLSAGPLFDVHLHYNAAHATHYSRSKIIQILAQNDIRQAVVTSTPAHLAKHLYQQAPERIVPLLGVYRGPDDKTSWQRDGALPARIEAELRNGGWRGIGELHLFAEGRHSPVFRRIVELAVEFKLPLLLHADPAVIDALYDIAPDQPVIWAHAGTFPYPDLIADYLERYPALRIDVSMRDDRIELNGEIADAWYELFLSFPDRFMIGVDTFSASRWDDFGIAAARIRSWLALLPDEVASRLAYQNAAAFFDTATQGEVD